VVVEVRQGTAYRHLVTNGGEKCGLVVAKNDNLFDAVIVIVSLVTVNVFEAMLFFLDVARIAVVGIVR
jgi:hypothetical protein